MNENVIYGTLPSDSIHPSESELRARIGCPPENIEGIDEIYAEVKKSLRPKYAYTFTDIKRYGEVLDLGFGKIFSRDLNKNLNGCRRACLLVVTLGSDTDRHLMKLSKVEPVDNYFADAIASAFAESLIDEAERIALGDTPHKARYSIGYGDVPLHHQKEFLCRLDAEKTVGITLTERMLMIPSKSITAIIGIKE